MIKQPGQGTQNPVDHLLLNALNWVPVPFTPPLGYFGPVFPAMAFQRLPCCCSRGDYSGCQSLLNSKHGRLTR